MKKITDEELLENLLEVPEAFTAGLDVLEALRDWRPGRPVPETVVNFYSHLRENHLEGKLDRDKLLFWVAAAESFQLPAKFISWVTLPSKRRGGGRPANWNYKFNVYYFVQKLRNMQDPDKAFWTEKMWHKVGRKFKKNWSTVKNDYSEAARLIHPKQR